MFSQGNNALIRNGEPFVVPFTKKRKTNSMDQDQYAIPTFNRFNVRDFRGGATDAPIYNETNKNVNNKKNIKIPPIISNLSPSMMYGILSTQLKLKDFTYKATSIGTKVWLTSNDDTTKLSDFLKSNKHEFFTFTKEADKTIKFVLFGIPNMEINIIENDLNLAGCKPIKIEKFIPKNVKYADEAIYFLSFTKGLMTLNKLRNIRAIAHCICKFEYANTKSRGPAQCRNCHMYGHGTANCNMKTKCSYCGVDHGQSVCPVKDIEANHICTNCKGNHSANSPACPARLEYLKIKTIVNQRNNNRINRRNQSFLFGESSFPALPTRQTNNMNMSQHAPAPTSQQYSTVLNNQDNYNNINNNSNLFNSSEIIFIFKDIIQSLKECKSKEDQFTKIAELAVKYIG